MTRRKQVALSALGVASAGMIFYGLAPSGQEMPRVSPTVLLSPTVTHENCKFFVSVSTGAVNPDPACTPGKSDPLITKTQVCNGEAAARPRRVSRAMKDQVIRAYGLDPATFKGEVDHFVSRELGGTDVIENLWPETGPVPNSKDTVENRLKRAVCSGQITLENAQTRVRYWYSQYSDIKK